VKKAAFYARIGNGTREITDQAQKQKHVSTRWGEHPAAPSNSD